MQKSCVESLFQVVEFYPTDMAVGIDFIMEMTECMNHLEKCFIEVFIIKTMVKGTARITLPVLNIVLQSSQL